ncbi:MAG: glucuronate isomerase [Armatimonadota bacterium]|nr:MAG: glucuronate isomerase [Armatimonadota bacterium]
MQDSAAVNDMRRRVREALSRVPVTDIHTHVYAPAFGELLLWGIDELLNHHYLIAETLRWGEVTPAEFWEMDRRQQADLVWNTLFLDHSPVSAAAEGLLEVLRTLGLDTASRDLESYRAFFASQTPEGIVDRVFECAGLESLVMTNDPFDDTERAVWESGPQIDARFHAALRLDSLILAWDTNYPRLRDWGYDVEGPLGGRTIPEVRRFLHHWIDRMEPLYLMLSLSPSWRFPDGSQLNRLLEECMLAVAAERGLPVALMPGCRRQVNPDLRLAGDSVGVSDLASLERLLARYPKLRFLVTVLSRENQYELNVVARKFPNLMTFGCWWFLNIPYLIDEMTRMRVELLGFSHIPHHSDVRVMEQVIPKWTHARHFTEVVLAERYAALEETGWKVTDAEIERDCRDLMGRNFWRFIGRM